MTEKMIGPHMGEENERIARTILEQLSNGKPNQLIAMVGAYHVFSGNGEISFKFKGCKRINYVRIKLNEKDLYDIEFGKINLRTYDYEIIETYKDVYFDRLNEIFRTETGLDTTLGSMRG